MDDPKDLVADPADAAERVLLRAGRLGAPPGAKERAVAAVSGALGGALVSSSAAASSALAAAGGAVGATKAGSLAVIVWMGVAGIGAVAGAVYVREVGNGALSIHPPVAVAPAPARERPPPPLTMVPDRPHPLPPPSATAPPPPPFTTRAASTRAPTPPGTSTPAPVGVEVAMLDGAGRALSSGDPARALSILDVYVTRFPDGAMAPEATLLRIEALLQAGDRRAAERAAAVLVQRDPNGPYLSRVQTLLGRSNR